MHCYYELLARCPLKCKHCHLPPEVKEKGVVKSIEQARREFVILNELFGVDSITISGGEPTIHPQLDKVVEIARDIFREVYVITRLVPKKTWLDEVDGVYLSIDYVFERHDEMRGVKGLFDAKMKALAHDKVHVRSTVLPDNYEDILTLLVLMRDWREYLPNRKKAPLWTLIPCKDLSGKNVPDGTTMRKILRLVMKYGLLKGGRVFIDSPSIRTYLSLYLMSIGEDKFVIDNLRERGGRFCDAVTSLIKVDYNGIVTACPFFNERIVALEMVSERASELLVKYRDEFFSRVPKGCEGCSLLPICGGCRATYNLDCVVPEDYRKLPLALGSLRVSADTGISSVRWSGGGVEGRIGMVSRYVEGRSVGLDIGTATVEDIKMYVGMTGCMRPC